MGIDIYMYVERRQSDGSWRFAGNTKANDDFFFGGDEHYTEEDSKPWPPFIPAEAFDLGRNYALFAILANVRNGMRTADGQHFEYISLPRGLPEDLSPELREYADLWGDGFQSPTWLLLEEIIRFPWQDKTMLHEAMVDARVAPLFGYEKPQHSWQEWMPAEKPRTGFPLAEWPDDIPISYAVYYSGWVTVQWIDTCKDIAQDFLDHLALLHDLGDPADTRLVFWFD